MSLCVKYLKSETVVELPRERHLDVVGNLRCLGRPGRPEWT